MLIGKVKHLPQVDESLQSSSVKSNFIDTEIFESALEDAKTVRDTIYERNEDSPFFKKLSEDIFHALYKQQPEVYAKENVHESLKMEHDLLSDIIRNDKFEKLRGNTAGDIFNSTLSLSSFQEKAYSKIQEWAEQSKENQEMMDKMNDAIQKQEMLSKLMEEAQYDPDNHDLQNQIEQAKKAVQQANDAMKAPGQSQQGQPGQVQQNQVQGEQGQSVPTGMQGLKNQLQDIMQETAKEVQEAADALDSFGLSSKGGNGESGALSTVPYSEKKLLVDALSCSNKIKQIAKQLGRVQESVKQVGKKPSKYGQSVCDIGLGNNIKRVLSTDRVKLVDPDLEHDFYKRYLDKSLLEYKTQGAEEHKGPIVICVDNSGSMSGQRDNWAKAVAIALLQISMKEKRDYRCIFFARDVTGVFDFNKENYDLSKVIELGEFWRGGGTQFEPALRKALESIEESRYKKADILFITDGDPNGFLTVNFKDKLRRTKEAKGFNIQSILIGSTNREYVEEFSDSIIEMKDLNKNNDLVNIFNKIQEQA